MEVKEEGDEGNMKEGLWVLQTTYFPICLESTLSRSISDDVPIWRRDSCGRKRNMVLHKAVHFCDHSQLSRLLAVFFKAGKLA